MARYYYKAVNTVGRVVDGHIEAASESDLELRVSNMDLELIRYKKDKAPRFLQRNRVDTKELITFTYHLEQLLNAGVPLIEALQDLRDSVSQGVFKDVASSLIENIGTGRTFSQALAQHPKVFSTVYVNMVNVGETIGQLVKVLHDLAGMLRWQYELSAKARKMTVYPSFIIVIVTAVIIFLMTYLVPKLVPFIKMAGGVIPWYTQLLFDTSEFVYDYWYLIFGLPTLTAIALKSFARHSPSLRFWIDNLKLKIPFFGSISYKIKLARFCNYFALMYASGITVLDSISLGKRIMNNQVLEDALNRVQDQISDGEAISISFANVGLFPALVVRMIRVGENTGAMSEALMNVSYFYNNEVKDSIDTLEPAIMPLLTVFLGMIVAWIMVAVMWPIYDSIVAFSAF